MGLAGTHRHVASYARPQSGANPETISSRIYLQSTHTYSIVHTHTHTRIHRSPSSNISGRAAIGNGNGDSRAVRFTASEEPAERGRGWQKLVDVQDGISSSRSWVPSITESRDRSVKSSPSARLSDHHRASRYFGGVRASRGFFLRRRPVEGSEKRSRIDVRLENGWIRADSVSGVQGSREKYAFLLSYQGSRSRSRSRWSEDESLGRGSVYLHAARGMKLLLLLNINKDTG